MSSFGALHGALHRAPHGARAEAPDGRRRWVGGELTLPADGVEISVVGRGHTFGRVVLVGDWGVGVSIEQCSVAVALVDQLGAALAADTGSRPTNEWNLS